MNKTLIGIGCILLAILIWLVSYIIYCPACIASPTKLIIMAVLVFAGIMFIATDKD